MTKVGKSFRSFAADPVVKAGSLTKTWETRLVSCVVDENVGLPDVAVLTYRDGDNELLRSANITIGTPLTVSVVAVESKAQEQLFGGEVTALEKDSDSTGSFTVIRAMSMAHRLFRGRRVEAFCNLTAAEVVRKVARNAGLTVGRVQVSSVTYAQISQAGTSDWDFLQRLAHEHGVSVQVDDTGKLELLKPKPAAGAPGAGTPSPLVLRHGDLLSLRASLTSSDRVDNVEVRAWDVVTKKALVAVEPAVRSTTVVPELKPAVAGKPATMLIADTPYATRAETDVVAQSLAAAVSAGYAEVEAVVKGHPKLRAGVPISVTNAGKAFNGVYTATSVRHVLDPHEGYRSTVTVSGSPDRSLAGLALGGAAASRTPRMPGLATGIVTDIREPGTGQRGWVRLKFPWLDDVYVTDWVRTVQWGGINGGGVFSPEVNDEVLVGFEQGSLDRPYVIGGLYNGVDRPSPHDVPLVDPTKGGVNRRSLVSRSGNRLELLDSPTTAGVRLQTGDKRVDITMDEKTGSVDIEVRTPQGAQVLGSISMTPRGITVDARNGDLVLKGHTVSVEARTSVSVQGVTEASVDGGARAVLKGRIVEIN
ncbi:VgrG-related protein [Saccharothrix saharensis]|uniref:VgrG-related protein n=1 Tax=Saccharothrix saharensis TaxID=571190 RepID=UPI0036834B64